jgi:hypothetical protein
MIHQIKGVGKNTGVSQQGYKQKRKPLKYQGLKLCSAVNAGK